MNIVGKNVHKYRESLNLSLDELGRLSEWDKKNLHRLEQTGSGYSHASISRLAKALGVSLGALFNENFETLEFGRPVPLDIKTAIDFSRSAPIQQLTTGGQIQNIVMSDGSFGEKAFAYLIEDESMAPSLRIGDILIVDPAIEPAPNDIVLAALYRNEDIPTLLVRRYADRENGYELLPSDNGYAAERASPSLEILGTVVEERRQRRKRAAK